MKTTLNIIKETATCQLSWERFLDAMGKDEPGDAPLELSEILRIGGIQQATWALGAFSYLDTCLFAADVAESVLHIYESRYESSAPRRAIEAVRDFKAGKIIKEELRDAGRDAKDASDCVYRSAKASIAANAAAYAANNAHYTAYAVAYTAVTAVTIESAMNYRDAYKAAANDYMSKIEAHGVAVSNKKWDEIEALFVAHFCK